jgi:hypothetical protein
MFKATARVFVYFAFYFFLLGLIGTGATRAFAQQTFFTPGNLVVSVEGCGVHAGTCTNVLNGTGTGSGNSSVGGYGDNQGAPLTLFQYTPNGTASATFVNSLVLPQSASGANLPISGEYGSSSEAGIQLSGTGQYLTIMGYGINAATFDANPATYGAAPSLALAQSGSLTGQSYTPIPRTLTLIDPYGNVNSSTAVYNIFNTNNPRSAYTLNGTTAYLSGQGASGDATAGVFYVPVGAPNTAPTAITGLDTTGKTVSQDTRAVQIYNNTLYVSVDSKGGSNSARSFIGTLGTPPATSLFNSSNGPTQLTGFGTSATGKYTITTGSNSNGNAFNSGLNINLSPVTYFFASPSILYVADSGTPKQNSATSLVGDGGLQKWINTKSDGSGTWNLAYTLYQGLNLVLNTSGAGSSGLYGLAGTVSGNTAQLYATNYTLSDLDLTYLYGITDNLTFTTATQASGETFAVLDTAPADSNFKGVSFAPSLPAGSATITSSPSGLAFTSAGSGCAAGTYTTPVTLIWTPGSSCTLSVVTPQTSAGAQYLFTQWEDGTTSTTHSVTAPAISAVYNASFTQAQPGIYSPVNGSALTATSATFQWYGYTNATAYWLDVGAEQGGHEYYSSGSLSTSTFSQTVSSLPLNGSTVWARWYYLLNGTWQSIDYSYTAFGGSSNKGVITSPPPSSTLSGSSVTFTWTAGTGATSYWVDAGSTSGSHNYFSSGSLGNVLTTTVSGLPTNGSAVYITLYSLVSGNWLSNGYTYTAFSLSASSGVLTTPTPGSVLTSGTVTFGWTAGSGASSYWIDVGSTTGAHDYYSSGSLGNVTSTTVSGLPTDGSTIYVTLYSLIGATWSGTTYNYTALKATGGLAVITSPTNGSTLSGNVITFSWSTDASATAYWLDIGTAAGGNTIYSSGNLGNVQTTTVSSLPADGSMVYTTLYSFVGGQWLSTSASYVSGP